MLNEPDVRTDCVSGLSASTNIEGNDRAEALQLSACDRVRRVVHEVCEDLGDVAHVEIDLDANPATARRFSVLSLPTTLIFDVDGRQRYRAAGVPKTADLRSALVPLLA